MEQKKRVYTFGNGKAEGNAQMREQLGGKGANCAEMNLIGVPVPPGFNTRFARVANLRFGELCKPHALLHLLALALLSVSPSLPMYATHRNPVD